MEEKTAGQVIEVFQSDRKHTQESLRVFYLWDNFWKSKSAPVVGFMTTETSMIRYCY